MICVSLQKDLLEYVVLEFSPIDRELENRWFQPIQLALAIMRYLCVQMFSIHAHSCSYDGRNDKTGLIAIDISSIELANNTTSD